MLSSIYLSILYCGLVWFLFELQAAAEAIIFSARSDCKSGSYSSPESKDMASEAWERVAGEGGWGGS